MLSDSGKNYSGKIVNYLATQKHISQSETPWRQVIKMTENSNTSKKQKLHSRCRMY